MIDCSHKLVKTKGISLPARLGMGTATDPGMSESEKKKILYTEKHKSDLIELVLNKNFNQYILLLYMNKSYIQIHNIYFAFILIMNANYYSSLYCFFLLFKVF